MSSKKTNKQTLNIFRNVIHSFPPGLLRSARHEIYLAKRLFVGFLEKEELVQENRPLSIDIVLGAAT